MMATDDTGNKMKVKYRKIGWKSVWEAVWLPNHSLFYSGKWSSFPQPRKLVVYSLEKAKQGVSGLGNIRWTLWLELIISGLSESCILNIEALYPFHLHSFQNFGSQMAELSLLLEMRSVLQEKLKSPNTRVT